MTFSEPEIRQALMQAGSLLPMNAKAVEDLDSNDPLDELALPPSLACDRILERVHAPGPVAMLKFPQPSTLATAAEGLARAARNGEELPDEVVAQMQEDRARIEGQSK